MDWFLSVLHIGIRPRVKMKQKQQSINGEQIAKTNALPLALALALALALTAAAAFSRRRGEEAFIAFGMVKIGKREILQRDRAKIAK